MKPFKQAKLAAIEIEDILLSLMLLTMLVICTMQVIWRYLLQASLSWSEELARYIFVWLVWLAAAYAMKKMRHLRITFLKEFTPQKFQWIFDLLALLMTVVFSVVFSKIAIQMVRMIAVTGQRSPAMGLPMWIPYLSVPVGILLIGFRAAQNIYGMFVKKTAQDDPKGGEML